MSTTGRQRVEAALGLVMADRPPVSAWGHAYAEEWSPDRLVAATVGIARRCELDFVKLQVRMTCFAEAFGGRWRYSGSPEREPVLEHAGGETAEDWRRIAESEPARAVLSEQVDVLGRVVADLGPGVPVIQTVFSPGMVAWFLAGRSTARLLELVRGDQELMAAGMARIAETLAWFSQESTAAGAAGVFYAINPLADTSVVGAADYDRWFLESDRTAFAGAEGGWFNMLHLCSGHVNESLIEKLGSHCVNWSIHDAGNPGLTELRDRHVVAVAGGLHRDEPIRSGSVGAVRAEADAALRDTGGRGHLLSPGCSVSPWPFEREENVRELAAAAAAA